MRTNAHSNDASGYWLSPSPQRCLVSSRGFRQDRRRTPVNRRAALDCRAALCPSKTQPERRQGAWIFEEM